MKAEIRQITWNGQVYYKLYAENMNGRMVLVLKRKFDEVDQAKEAANLMLPTYDLSEKVKKQSWES